MGKEITSEVKKLGLKYSSTLRSGSLPGLLMVLSADDKSIFTAPELLLNSIGLEDLFFIILIGVAGCCPITPPKNHKNIPITACMSK